MFGTISKTGKGVFFFIAGDDGGNYYSQFDWVDASFRDKVEKDARVEFQARVFLGKKQAFAVRAEGSVMPDEMPVAKKTVRFDEHHDRRLALLHSILGEGRKPTEEELKILFAVWLTNPQGHLLMPQYDCSHCARHSRFYRERFDGLYVLTFGLDQPAVILCDKCRQRFFQLYPSCQAKIEPLYDTLEKLGIRPNSRGLNTVGQAASFHRRENNRRPAKPVFKGSEKARKRNEALVEEFSQRWGGQKTA